MTNKINLVASTKDAASGPLAKIRSRSDDLGTSAVTTGGKMDKLGATLKTVGKVALVAGAAMAAAVLVAGKELLGLGTRLEQMDAKAQTVFGDQKALVDAWAKANANAMGATSREATGMAADFADLLIPMKFTRAEATKMATDVVGLSGALSQWTGGTRTAAEVSHILAKAMLGERESLKELGISILDADVKQRLLEKGQQKLTGAALEQAKAIATQELIFEKSLDAQAAYAAGTDTLIGKQAAAGAKFRELGDEIAVGLMPVFHTVTTFIVDELVPAVRGVIGKVQAWVVENKPLIDQIAHLAGSVLKELWETIGTVVTWIGNFVDTIAANKDAMNVLKTIATGIGDAFVFAWGAVKTLIGWIADLVGNIKGDTAALQDYDSLWSNIGRIIDVVADNVRALRDAAIQAYNAMYKLTHLGAPGKVKGPGGNKSYDTRKGYASGGWVGLKGPELAMLGERGPEYIIPNHQLVRASAGGGGSAAVTHVTHITKIYLDKRVLADVVDKELFGPSRSATGF